MHYIRANQLATRIAELLQPWCTVLHIAGSIRRQKPDVKDIEIVCLPIKNFRETDLFGGGLWETHSGFITAINQVADEIIKGTTQGRMMQVRLKGGMMLDLFMPQQHDYYRQYAIRTGSSRYSNMIIANGWKNLGWCGTDDGLRRIDECDARQQGDKTIYKCYTKDPTLPPVWQSERAFFDWLQIDWIQPHLRELQDTQNLNR